MGRTGGKNDLVQLRLIRADDLVGPGAGVFNVRLFRGMRDSGFLNAFHDYLFFVLWREEGMAPLFGGYFFLFLKE